MTTITNTTAFKNAPASVQNAILSPSLIGVFEAAIDCKESGYTYAQWLNSTSAGPTAKAIVKEIFGA